MKTKKRLFNLLLCVIMLFSAFPATASAEEGGDDNICGCALLCTDENINADCPVCSQKGTCRGAAGDEIQNTAAAPRSGGIAAKVGNDTYSSLADAVAAVTGAGDKTGTVQIVENIELSEFIVIPSGADITITDDGEAHTVTMASSAEQRSYAAFVVERGGSLTIDGANLTFTRQASAERVSGLVVCHGEFTLQDGTFDFNGQTVAWNTNTNSASAVIHACGEDAVFTMNGGTIQNAFLNTNTAGVQVSSDASFILNGGVIKDITGGGSARSGAVLVYAPDTSYNFGKGTAYFEMNGGTITENTGYRGAGVHVVGQSYNYRATMILNDGTISANSCNSDMSQLAGGAGIYIEGNAEVTMNGGSITDNTVTHGVGGGVCTIDGYTTNFPNPDAPGAWPIETYSRYYPAAFTMLGGTISGNQAKISGESEPVTGDGGCGGGVYCASDRVTLRGGVIENNKADRQGGGVYIGSIPYTLSIYNAVVTANTASVLGGGIWACPTGDAEVFVTNGAGVFGNVSDGAGDDVVSVKAGEEKYVLTLPDRMLGAGRVQWYKDGGLADDGSVLGNPDDSPRYDPEGNAQPIVQIQNASDPYALKAEVSTEAQTLAEDCASLFIRNNSAARGGGIGTNGGIIMGERDNEYTLSVTKDWVDTDESDMAPVTVYLTVGHTVLDSVTLNAENDWTADFTRLPDPATLPEGLCYGVVENPAPEHFTPAYSEAIIDESTRRIVVKVTNTRQPTGGLTVCKTVSGSAADETREFSFTVTLDDTSVSGTYGDMVFTNGTATFALKHGEKITALGLPAGVGYAVTEESGDYTVTSTGENGYITAGQITEAAFNNHKDKTSEPQNPSEPNDKPSEPDNPGADDSPQTNGGPLWVCAALCAGAALTVLLCRNKKYRISA